MIFNSIKGLKEDFLNVDKGPGNSGGRTESEPIRPEINIEHELPPRIDFEDAFDVLLPSGKFQAAFRDALVSKERSAGVKKTIAANIFDDFKKSFIDAFIESLKENDIAVESKEQLQEYLRNAIGSPNTELIKKSEKIEPGQEIYELTGEEILGVNAAIRNMVKLEDEAPAEKKPSWQEKVNQLAFEDFRNFINTILDDYVGNRDKNWTKQNVKEVDVSVFANELANKLVNQVVGRKICLKLVEQRNANIKRVPILESAEVEDLKRAIDNLLPYQGEEDDSPVEILKNSTKEGLFEYRLQMLNRAFEIWKEKISKLDPQKDKLEKLNYYLKKATDVKKNDIKDEYLIKLNKGVEKVKAEITKIWKAKKQEFDDFEKDKGVGMSGEKEEGEETSDKKWELKESFESAKEAIEDVSDQEFEEKYSKNIIEEFGADYREILKIFIDSDLEHLHDSIDALHEEERKLWNRALEVVGKINSRTKGERVIFAKGKTYLVKDAIIDEQAEDVVDGKEKKEIRRLPENLEKVFENYGSVLREKIQQYFFGESGVYANASQEERDVILKASLREGLLEKLFSKIEYLKEKYSFSEDDGKELVEELLKKILK